MIFTCNHEVGVGSPELVAEEGCVIEFNWVSILACPPHYMVINYHQFRAIRKHTFQLQINQMRGLFWMFWKNKYWLGLFF